MAWVPTDVEQVAAERDAALAEVERLRSALRGLFIRSPDNPHRDGQFRLQLLAGGYGCVIPAVRYNELLALAAGVGIPASTDKPDQPDHSEAR